MEINEVIQQGEVRIKRIADLSNTKELKKVNKPKGGYILSHSESGHHHILRDGELLERKGREGLEMFYAILDNPSKITQDAANPHEDQNLPAGIYDIRISREYNPFLKEARRVSD